MRIIGVDPGISGALALLMPDGGITTAPMPVFRPATGKATIDAPAVKRWLESANSIDARALLGQGAPSVVTVGEPCHVFIERAQAMPAGLRGRVQGGSSAFAYGVAFGTLIGIVATLGLPYTLVMPAIWKKAFKLDSDKERARQTATRLFPAFAEQWRRKGDHGIAEAALIAAWGSQQLGLSRWAA